MSKVTSISDRPRHRRNLAALRALSESFNKHEIQSVAIVCVTDEPKPRFLLRITEELSLEELSLLGTGMATLASEMQNRIRTKTLEVLEAKKKEQEAAQAVVGEELKNDETPPVEPPASE